MVHKKQLRKVPLATLLNWVVQECQNLASMEKTNSHEPMCISMRTLVTRIRYLHKVDAKGINQHLLTNKLRERLKELNLEWITIKN